MRNGSGVSMCLLKGVRRRGSGLEVRRRARSGEVVVVRGW